MRDKKHLKEVRTGLILVFSGTKRDFGCDDFSSNDKWSGELLSTCRQHPTTGVSPGLQKAWPD